MTVALAALLALLAAITLVYLWHVWQWSRRQSADRGRLRTGPIDTATGFVTDFFDTLGIGSFATTTTFKLLRRVPAELIPGSPNVGHALPLVAQAFIVKSLPLTSVCWLAMAVMLFTAMSMLRSALKADREESGNP